MQLDDGQNNLDIEGNISLYQKEFGKANKFLFETLTNYYKNRNFVILENSVNPEWGGFKIVYLLDRKYVIRYEVFKDRGSEILGSLSMAIGPYFLSPSEFWSEEMGSKFHIQFDAFFIKINLDLLERYLVEQKTK